MTKQKTITASRQLMDKKTFRKIFWRSFLLQGSWNYINGAGVGALYMILPFIRKLYPNPEDKNILILRQQLHHFRWE